MNNALLRYFLVTSVALTIVLFPSCRGGRTPIKAGVSAESEARDGRDDHEADEHALPGTPRIESMVSGDERLRIIATTNIIGDVVAAVAGNDADLAVLMPPGQNPHSWSPTPREVTRLAETHLVFVNGMGLEGELLDILEGLDGPIVVPISTGIAILSTEDSEASEGSEAHHHEAGDPHTWFSPRNVMQWTENAADALAAADPANRAAYRSAAATYRSRLEALDAEITAQIGALDPNHRRIITDHASLAYFARDYGLTIVGHVISGVNDQAESSARQVAELSHRAAQEDVAAIIVGNTAGRGVIRLAEAVAAESGRRLPIATILSGSLAPPGERGGDYIDFMRYNTEILVDVLNR